MEKSFPSRTDSKLTKKAVMWTSAHFMAQWSKHLFGKLNVNFNSDTM